MSKKLFTFTSVFTAIILSSSMCGCGVVENSNRNSSVAMTTADTTTTENTISKSPNKAVRTIENLIQKSVKVEANFKVADMNSRLTYVTNVKGEEDLVDLWTLDYQVCEPYSIIFLYGNDEKALMATESKRDFVEGNCVVESEIRDAAYHNELNSSADGAFAWKFSGCASIVLGYDAGFDCSSIWAYNQKEETVSLIWYDEELEIWK